LKELDATSNDSATLSKMKQKRPDSDDAATTNRALFAGGAFGGSDDEGRSAGSADDELELSASCAAALLTEGRGAEGFRHVFARLAPHLELEAFALFGGRVNGQALHLEASVGLGPEAEAPLIAALAPMVAKLATAARRTRVVNARTTSGEPLTAALRALGFAGGLAVTLACEGRALGALLLASRVRNEFTPGEVALVDIVGSCLAALQDGRAGGRAAPAIDTARDEFLTVLAHELRNPLAPVRNALEIIRANERHPSAVERSAHAMIERQLEQIAWLADDLLDANEAALGRVELDKRRVHLATVIERAAAQSRAWIESSRHELIIDLPREPIGLDADPKRLSRVFSNLLNSAARHMGRGGRIEIMAERHEELVAVLVRATAGGGSAASLRELFTSAGGEAVLDGRSQGGFTAGVALVKHFVEMHGGKVMARGDGERVVEFIVTLPLAAPGPVRAPLATDRAGQRNGPQRILVADDNADSAESMGMLLRLMGNDVRIASDGLEAVEQAAAFQPDIILLDIGMPRLDGYEAARRIRLEEWGRDTLLVAITGWGPRDDDGKAAAAGFDLHFTKPLDPAELRKLVSQPRQQ
jgi:CheY-like chemotaxis protein